MNQTYTASERRFCTMVRSMACVICKRNQDIATGEPVELHHVGEGSSRQCNWLVAPLCSEHHRGGSGLHGMGSKAFVRLYKIPHGTEYGLLAWVNQDIQESLGLKRAA